MALVDQINALATRIAAQFRDTVMPRVLPAGGSTGQVLTKTAGTNYSVNWQTPSGGGGGGSQQVFVQQTRPTETGPWVWWQTNASGQIVNLIVNDGA